MTDLEVFIREQRETIAELKRESATFIQTIAVGDLVDSLDKSNVWRIG